MEYDLSMWARRGPGNAEPAKKAEQAETEDQKSINPESHKARNPGTQQHTRQMSP